eukprot:13540593-Heterocapsa_arctica.AAC.1
MKDLTPACGRHLGDVGQIGDAAVLDLRLAAARQILGDATRDEASRVTAADRCQQAGFALERTQRRG